MIYDGQMNYGLPGDQFYPDCLAPMTPLQGNLFAFLSHLARLLE